MNDLNLIGKKVRVYLVANNYKYAGKVMHETDDFLTIFDEKSSSERIFNKEMLASMEVLMDDGLDVNKDAREKRKQEH